MKRKILLFILPIVSFCLFSQSKAHALISGCYSLGFTIVGEDCFKSPPPPTGEVYVDTSGPVVAQISTDWILGESKKICRGSDETQPGWEFIFEKCGTLLDACETQLAKSITELSNAICKPGPSGAQCSQSQLDNLKSSISNKVNSQGLTGWVNLRGCYQKYTEFRIEQSEIEKFSKKICESSTSCAPSHSECIEKVRPAISQELEKTCKKSADQYLCDIASHNKVRDMAWEEGEKITKELDQKNCPNLNKMIMPKLYVMPYLGFVQKTEENTTSSNNGNTSQAINANQVSPDKNFLNPSSVATGSQSSQEGSAASGGKGCSLGESSHFENPFFWFLPLVLFQYLIFLRVLKNEKGSVQ